VPDVTVYLREYAERSAAAKASLACMENIAYGLGDDDRLDLFPVPGARGRSPVIVFLHGGDWRALSKDDSAFAAPAYVGAGAMFVALDFTLVPQATLPEMGAQVRRALHWLWQNVALHGGDPARIHIAGHSSGANLVGQVLMTDWAREFDAPADLVKSACFMSGLGDLEPVRLSFRNEKLKLTPEVVAEVSLLRRGAVARCPLLVAVGGNETEDYLRQSREVADWWTARGEAAQFIAPAGRHHFDAVLEWADPASALFKAQARLDGSGMSVVKGPAVWLDMDQAELDAAYNQAAYASNVAEVLQRYAVRSEATRATLGEPLRFAYGDSAVEGLDVYPTKPLMRRLPFLSTAAPGARAVRATMPSPPMCWCPPARTWWCPTSRRCRTWRAAWRPWPNSSGARWPGCFTTRSASAAIRAASTCWGIRRAPTWPA
jgi:arylformamidase